MLRSRRFFFTLSSLALLAAILLLAAPGLAAADPNEPTDNEVAGATKLYFGVPFEGYLGQAGDVDHYYIDVPAR